MKKEYIKPALETENLSYTAIIAATTLDVVNDPTGFSGPQAKQDFGLWEDDAEEDNAQY